MGTVELIMWSVVALAAVFSVMIGIYFALPIISFYQSDLEDLMREDGEPDE